MQRIVHEQGAFRIVEHDDSDFDIENIIGDGTTDAERSDLIDLINREGVFGYVLEKWNDQVGIGWEHIDSCWGFVGAYTPNEEMFNHYIVEEMKGQIK